MTKTGVAMERQLTKPLIRALDAARSLSAIYVVIHHVAQARDWTTGPGIILRFGQEAVIIFFLLSGFVIFVNERNRANSDFMGYLLRRVRRIYPALIVAILLSVCVAVSNGNFTESFSWDELFGTLLGLSDASALKPGVIVNPFMGNEPLWSLSYEIAFYCVFPAVLVAWKRWSNVTSNLVGILSCITFVAYVYSPNHFTLVAAYFLIWWCGAMIAKAYTEGHSTFWNADPSIGWLVVLVMISAGAVGVFGYLGVGVYPFLMFRHFAVALLLIVVVFGPVGRVLAHQLGRRGTHFSAAASVSYGLYVFHYPLLIRWEFAQSPVGLVLASVALIAVSYLGDRQLNIWLPRPKILRKVYAAS